MSCRHCSSGAERLTPRRARRISALICCLLVAGAAAQEEAPSVSDTLESALDDAQQQAQEVAAEQEEPSVGDTLDTAVGDAQQQVKEEKLEEVVPSEAEQRELGSDEDPMAADRARREVERVEEPVVEKKRTTGFDVYGSARIRYRSQDTVEEFQDGGSRIGADVEWRVTPETFVYGRFEAGFNLLTGIDELTNPGEKAGEEFSDTIFRRLGYVGLDNPVVNAVFGKNWSAYYKVSFFTDRFMGTGGSASGTYNAQTDGGPTGTGRADRTLQSHFRIGFLPERWFKPFDLNAQLQYDNPIPFGDGENYGLAAGLSAVMTLQNDFTLGIAYNGANVDDTAGLRRIGLDGDARATLIGTRAFGDKWYAGFIYSRLSNHETTDEGVYFDGSGSELYAQYNFTGRWWAVGGYNALEPDDDQRQAGDYRIRYGVLGLRYSLDEFRRMIFFNLRLDDSRNADGSKGSNVVTIGLRWDVSNRGWHFPD